MSVIQMNEDSFFSLNYNEVEIETTKTTCVDTYFLTKIKKCKKHIDRSNCVENLLN